MLTILAFFVVLSFIIARLNKEYYLLAGCKRVKTIDGGKLEEKIEIIKGQTIFGNCFDLLDSRPKRIFDYVRENSRKSKGKSYLLYFCTVPMYNVTNAKDAEEVFQSQTLLTKGFVYDLMTPFLGMGLLNSTDEKWQFRRKMLTPAFHFNILQNFLEIFKEESHKFVENLEEQDNHIVNLHDIIPQFTLNNVCETALGVKLDNIPGSDLYRQAIRDIEPLLIKRSCNPLHHFDFIYGFFNDGKEQKRLTQSMHAFSSQVIHKKRQVYRGYELNSKKSPIINDLGQKQRYAMLDTLLDAEIKGLIDHQGICDEVNTFMFEGYDTTSTCLMFTLVNLAIHQDVQEKCYDEIKYLGLIDSLSVFDINNLDYLECVIKESLRLYPPVPLVVRACVNETVMNGMLFPKNTQINIHIFDILRDERNFPEPLKFDPERFRSTSLIDRQAFAFVPFSAGPRNCIGQRFAMLEIKVLLLDVLRKFKLLPVTKLEELVFENGMILRCQQDLKIKIQKRN